MTIQELRQKLEAQNVPEHYINLICDPCEDAEEDGEEVLNRAWNVANEEGSYLKSLADMIAGWEKDSHPEVHATWGYPQNGRDFDCPLCQKSLEHTLAEHEAAEEKAQKA